MQVWHKLLESDLPALNQQLKQAGFSEIKIAVEQLSH
jgi:flagellar hook-length control protein FliK